ncbi:MAG: hypothetical protein Q9227_004231 [Pyrenula ochraceoflavens]
MAGHKRKAGDSEDEAPSAKRLASSIESSFALHLFSEKTVEDYRRKYVTSTPYRHGVIPSLISEELLRNVRSEITTHLSFTPKETDIYKIHQSGDLANLSGLDAAALSKLPSLLLLRDALYSSEFRHFLSQVTGCGPLSGQKTDMAVNVYTAGSYLLCHDDVIGTRRVSYILYLTDPEEGKQWRPEWGGALRLYPTEKRVAADGTTANVPSPHHIVAIPPSFGQLSFFEVQPGESYHDVEEVSYPSDELWRKDKVQWNEDMKMRNRMAISGWFHIPQEGEDGFEVGLEEKLKEKSSLSQLESHADDFDQPAEIYDGPNLSESDSEEFDTVPDIDGILDESECELLLQFISPGYVAPDMAEQLSSSFEENSFLRLDDIFNQKFAAALKGSLERLESTSGTLSSELGWTVAAPPHKHRYLFFRKDSLDISCNKNATDYSLYSLVHDLFPSVAFRKWLAVITGYKTSNFVQWDYLTRRFRRGKDYALASAYGTEGDEQVTPRLELTFDITPFGGWEEGEAVQKTEMGGTSSSSVSDGNGENLTQFAKPGSRPPIEAGGSEIYMAADDESSHPTLPSVGRDPAVYRSAPDDEDDGILFDSAPSWNRLNIVLRDAGSLRFVKFVSGAAPCDRWDIKGTVLLDPEMEDDSDQTDVENSVGEEPREESGSTDDLDAGLRMASEEEDEDSE